jgi:hypothetical protein
MNAKEQAQQISQAIVETQKKLHDLEVGTYWFNDKPAQILRLKRVLRALDRDLDKIVATIPAPVQYDFFGSMTAHLSALEEQSEKPSEWTSGGELTPLPEVPGESRHSETEG